MTNPVKKDILKYLSKQQSFKSQGTSTYPNIRRGGKHIFIHYIVIQIQAKYSEYMSEYMSNM